jgi:hypothetical protein
MRASQALTAIAAAGQAIAQAFVGLVFMGGGGYVAFTALQSEPHDNKVLYAGLGAALFGALVFPSIFPIAQKIYVFVFPNGLPLLGGKRSGDPPAPPPAP